MSIECTECERDLRVGHADDCPLHPDNRKKTIFDLRKELTAERQRAEKAEERIVLLESLVKVETARREEAEAELAAVKEDAERYRLLQSEIERHDPMFSVVAKVHYDRRSSDWCNFASAKNMDAAIDAQRKP